MALDQLRSSLVDTILLSLEADGTSPTSYSTDPGFQKDVALAGSGFFHAVMLGALAEASLPELQVVMSRWADVLEAQLGDGGSVNYWLRGTAAAQTHPYPDDFDSTSCTLGALAHFRPAALSGDRLAKTVMALASCEVAEGGPYRTWLVPESSAPIWKDVDAAVNANIAYFLSTQEVHLKPLQAFLEARVQARDFASPYYPSPFPVWYFFARCPWLSDVRLLLQQEILAARVPDGGWGTVQQTALAISSLARLEADPEIVRRGVAWLEQALKAGCRAEAFCLDSVSEGKTTLAGSAALTACLCLEAFSLSDRLLAQGQLLARAELEACLLQGVQRELAAQVESMPVALRAGFEAMATQVLADARGQEIPLLPTAFWKACGAPPCVTEAQRITMGTANVLGWMAYTVLDDFLDEEGKPPLLPVATVALRRLDDLWHACDAWFPGFAGLACTVMDRMDAANAWEVNHCRLRRENGGWRLPEGLPDYSNDDLLADRSFGHALGPLAILLAMGHRAGSAPYDAITEFFRQYLIARQLDDDAHDWERDLRRGQLNRIGTQALRVWDERHGHIGGMVDDQLIEDLREWFWQTGIRLAALDIQAAVHRAEEALRACPLMVEPSGLNRLLEPMRRSASRALQEHQKAQAFLDACGGIERT